MMKRFVPGVIAIALSGLVYLSLEPALPKAEATWPLVRQAAPAKLQQQLQADYDPHLRPGVSVDVGQMKILTLQERGSLPLYVINTRVHPSGKSGLSPICGIGGCLFFAYIPNQDGFKQIFHGVINDFRVQGAPPVIQPVQRVVNQVPCIQITVYNAKAQRTNPPQTLCFNGQELVPAGNDLK